MVAIIALVGLQDGADAGQTSPAKIAMTAAIAIVTLVRTDVGDRGSAGITVTIAIVIEALMIPVVMIAVVVPSTIPVLVLVLVLSIVTITEQAVL